MITSFPDKRSTLKDLFCLEPFQTAMIDELGEVYICGCKAWLPTPVGNINDEPIDVILGNSISNKIRKSITNHSYTYCDEKVCKLIRNKELKHRNDLPIEFEHLKDWSETKHQNTLKRIFFAGDRTCNLSCPSCRTQVVKYDNQLQLNNKQKRDAVVDLFVKNLFSSPNHKLEEIVMSTSGEIFASEILLEVLQKADLSNFPRCKLHIQTNGLLMKDRWHRLKQWSDRVSTVNLTADACTKVEYERLRRGGRYERLIENLEWFKQKKVAGGINFIVKMVVQKDNIDQLEQFYDFAKSYNADEVHYARITDWGTMSPELFSYVDVLSPEHDLFGHASEQVRQFKAKNRMDAKFYG